MIMHHDTDADGDQEIMDTIRLYLYAGYANVEDGCEFSPEELERAFTSDAGLRAWVSDTIGIDPDTLAASTSIG